MRQLVHLRLGRKLLEETGYDDDAELAEEKKFLKNYTVPLFN